jgi:F-type H+-transporting ATPase subunit epsilon
MPKLTVEIVTPERRLASTQADEAIVPGAHGLFGVRPGHAPFVSTMEPGELTVRDGNELQRYFIAGGFVQVASDTVRVLADQAEPASEIDLAVARQQLTAAESRLKALAAGDARMDEESALLERARVRLQVATRAGTR